MAKQPPDTLRYKIRVVITQDVEVFIPKADTTPEMIESWCRGLWHIDGADDIAKHAATMAAQSGSGNYDGCGRLGTDIEAQYAPADSPIHTVYDIHDEDTEVEILERPEGEV